MSNAADFQDFNRKVIESFRANGMKPGGQWEGRPMLLLRTVGARSGIERTTPLVYLPEGDRVFVFASKAGAPSHPDWYHNLLAHPKVVVEKDGEQYEATAQVIADGDEHDRVYRAQEAAQPQFAEYREKTTRVIPVVELVRS